MDILLNRINELNPFVQSLLASALFALLMYITQRVWRKTKQTSSKFLNEYNKQDYFKHLVHKELLNSHDSALISKGYFIITIQAFRWIARGILILIFFLAVNSILTANWLMLLCYWFMFNCFLEAHTWLKDQSKDEAVSHVSQKIREEVIQVILKHDKNLDNEKLIDPSMQSDR